MSERIQAAPGLHGCCDAAGRMIMLAYHPIARERLVALAVARGEGTREQIEQRVLEMLAAGMLIELEV
jgi:DNA-binding TFAR19-related protein (PDSD5 family)